MGAQNWSNRYIKIPFRERSSGFDGCDCWGLHRLILKAERGVELPAFSEHPEVSETALLAECIEQGRRLFRQIPSGQEQPFDAILLLFEGMPIHIATVVRPGLMAHCLKGAGVRLTDYPSRIVHPNQIIGFFRWEGIPCN